MCIRGGGGGWCVVFFFFNDTATTEIYTLSLHDALPIFHAYPDRRLAYDESGSPACPKCKPELGQAANAKGINLMPKALNP